jgi:hypothetical protein
VSEEHETLMTDFHTMIKKKKNQLKGKKAGENLIDKMKLSLTEKLKKHGHVYEKVQEAEKLDEIY